MTTKEQEQKKLVDERFHRCYERPVLEAILKHSSDNLERLVEQCSAKLRGELFPGEPVVLHKGSVAAKIKGTVVKLDGPPVSRGAVSDKSATASPADHKYTVNMEQQEEMLEVVGIPGADLVRQNKLPSKDAIKAFIKTHAVCNEVTKEWRLMPGKAAEYGLKVGGHHADVNQLLQRQKQLPQADAKPPVSLVKPAALSPGASLPHVVSESEGVTAIGGMNGCRENEHQKPSDRPPKNGSSTISSAISSNSSSSSSKPAAAAVPVKKKKSLSNGGSRSEVRSEGAGPKRRLNSAAADGKKSSSKKAKITMDAFLSPKAKPSGDVSRAPEAGECPKPAVVPSADGRPNAHQGASAGSSLASGDAEKKPTDASANVWNTLTMHTTDGAKAPGRDTAPSAKGAAAVDAPSDAMSWDSDDSMVLSAVKKQVSPSKRDTPVAAGDPNGSEARGTQVSLKGSPQQPDKAKEKKKRKPKNSDGKSRIKTESEQRLQEKAYSSSDDEVALIAYKNGSSGTSIGKSAAGDRGSKKVGLKQTTLFDLSRKSLGSGSSANVAALPQQPVTPEVVHKYQKAQAELDFVRMQQLLQQAAIELSAQQREALPDSMRAAVREKHDYIELKKKMKFASAEDKAAMQKQLRSYRLKQAADKRRMMQTRCEDTNLELKPLPAARPVGSAEDAVAFAEAVRVSEFIRCYHGLLAPGNTEDSKVTAEILIQLLTGASAGDPQAVSMLGKIVAMLLQTLVNDERLEGVKVFGVPVRDIPVNAFTASEMVRLVLSDGDRAAADSASSDEPEADAKQRTGCGDPDGINGVSKDIADDLLSRLSVCEFSSLTANQNLAVLTALCDLVLCSRSAENYVTDKQQEAVESCKQRIAETKILNLRKNELEKQGNPADGDTAKRSSKEGSKSLGTSNQALAVAAMTAAADGANSDQAAAPDSDASDRGAGLTAVLRQRREQAAKSAREREQKLQQERVQREREAEVRRLVKQLETLEKLCTERTIVAKDLLRCTPLGYDRNHNRYWFFASAKPGIYMEQGWVGEEMMYRVQTATVSHATCESSERSIEGAAVAQPGEPTAAAEHEATKKTAATAAGQQQGALLPCPPKVSHSTDADLEKTHPMPDRNQWFVYDNQKDIDALLAALHPRGVRETALADNIRQLYPELTRLMKTTAGADTSAADAAVPTAAAVAGSAATVGNGAVSEQAVPLTRAEELANAVSKFREELEYQESRLRSGSLGGVSDVEAWLHAVRTSSDISALAARLIECGEAVIPKFIKGPTEPTPHGTESGTAVATPSSASADTKTMQGCVTEKQPQTDDPVQDAAAAANTFCISRWKEAVRDAATVSRLHVLLGILEACIRWDKSAENAKCKVCRRKGDEASLLLCDDCNMAFHTQCLRPALSEVPEGDWFCPACKPILPKRDAHIERHPRRPVSSLDSRDGSLHSDGDYDDRDRESDGSEASGDSSDESKEDKEDVGVCCVCSDGSGCLVVCTVCSAAYHLRCHSPPLRCPPVGTNWACIGCRASREVTSKKRSKQPLKNPATGDRSRQGRRERSPDTSDNDSETDEQDSDGSHGDARGSSGNKMARSESRSASRVLSAKILSKKGSRHPDQAGIEATGSNRSRRVADAIATVGSAKPSAASRPTRATSSKASDGSRPHGTVISTTLVDEGGSISDEDSPSYTRRERRHATVVTANQPPLMWKRGKREESEDVERDDEDEERKNMSQTEGEETTDDEESTDVHEIQDTSDEEYREKELGDTAKMKRKVEPSRSESRGEDASRGAKVSGGSKNGAVASAAGRARKAGSRESKVAAPSRDEASLLREKIREPEATGGRRSAKRIIVVISSDDSDASPSTKKQLKSRTSCDSDADLDDGSSSRRQATSRQSKQAAVVAIRNGYDSLSSESDSDSTAVYRNDTSGRKHAKQGRAKGQRSNVGHDDDDDDCRDMPRLDHWSVEGSSPPDAKRKKSSDDVQSSKRKVTSRDFSEAAILKSLDVLLQKLLKHPSSADFEEAVDPAEVPDYYDVVEKPITLINIRDKITKSQYNCADDFLSDMTLLFRNAFEYNKVDSEVGREAKRLEDEFIRLLGTSMPTCRYRSQYELFAASAAAAASGKASKQRR